MSAVAYAVSWLFFFFSSRRRHTRFDCDWSSDVCSSDLVVDDVEAALLLLPDRVGELVAVVPRPADLDVPAVALDDRSEERRVGKECRFWWVAYHCNKKLPYSQKNLLAITSESARRIFRY